MYLFDWAADTNPYGKVVPYPIFKRNIAPSISPAIYQKHDNGQ
jgi:hypothetical protein